MTRRRRSWLALVFLGLTTAAVPALAQPSSGQPTTEDQRKAQEHFQKARELYQAGSYREAVAELEVARALDPKAKDLVMNLAIVSEKLGKYDDALTWFKTYLEMEGVTPPERAKAETNIKRIEGAKREAAARNPPPPSSSSRPPPPPPTATASHTATPPVRDRDDAPRGRVDAATIIVGSIAVVGLGAGIGLGAYALSQRPSDFVTGRDGTYADLQSKTNDAHSTAIVADIALGVGVVAALATLYLYFGRPKDTPKRAWLTPTEVRF